MWRGHLVVINQCYDQIAIILNLKTSNHMLFLTVSLTKTMCIIQNTKDFVFIINSYEVYLYDVLINFQFKYFYIISTYLFIV